MDRQLFNHFIETEACAEQSHHIDNLLGLMAQVPALAEMMSARWRRLQMAKLHEPQANVADATRVYAEVLVEFYGAMAHSMAIGFQAGYSYGQTEAAGNVAGTTLEIPPIAHEDAELDSGETFVENTQDGWTARCPRCGWWLLVPYRKDTPAGEAKPLEKARFAARDHVCRMNGPQHRLAS